ncbi:MAG: HD domain-containing protein [Piscinibacter sp.]|uniref:HD-GYP domain-containing protein n=1 Tax=Piscinibacter sp. TaxID=1903157 RepID=UPI00258B56AB|nr:HD domain-containing phosphohydrolase [Piscinibacter sp.]MCW5668006.1 HD domain-containing protein [Piscinibacter sp.]
MNSSTPQALQTFRTANPHALATILEASETRRIIAATDIFDLAGTKLWARHQPVSVELQRKLMDRKLREPLEACLVAEDGVTPVTLGGALEQVIETDQRLAPLLRPQASKLMREVSHLHLHPVAQLLLSASQSARPEAFRHAVAAMGLAGALMVQHGGQTPEVRLAMLAGLLHDLGEMYIAPEHGEAEADRELDALAYRQLVVHPHVGLLLIAQLTNYPGSIARAVVEHHERLDGTGYPHARQADAMSPLGRLLAVTEAALAALRRPSHELLHASIALRAVPGEFDLAWVGRLTQAARSQPALQPVLAAEEVRARRVALGAVLHAAEENAGALVDEQASPAMRAALELALFLIGRLRAGWNESGLWSDEAATGADAGEVEAMEDELYFRLRGVQRAVLLRAGELPTDEATALTQLCESLPMGRAD